MSKALVRATRLIQASCIVNCHQLGLLSNQCPKAGALITRSYCSIPSSTLAIRPSQHLSVSTNTPTLSVRYSSTNANMSNTTAPADPAILEILNFWFEEIPQEAWFMPMPELGLDDIIAQRFTSYVEKAVNTNTLDHWTSTPAGTLALILCLDQLTRNIYRPGRHAEPGLSWSGDAKALQIASEAIAKGYDREVESQFKGSNIKGGSLNYRFFIYMPFMHAEDLVAQIASVALFENLLRDKQLEKSELQLEKKDTSKLEPVIKKLSEEAVPFAKKHLNCVATLGRFPMRNKPLGRDHTEEEKEWLEKFPMGF